ANQDAQAALELPAGLEDLEDQVAPADPQDLIQDNHQDRVVSTQDNQDNPVVQAFLDRQAPQEAQVDLADQEVLEAQVGRQALDPTQDNQRDQEVQVNTQVNQ
ncbi:Protein of unknown function, partial [Gryllus bimaculatus]